MLFRLVKHLYAPFSPRSIQAFRRKAAAVAEREAWARAIPEDGLPGATAVLRTRAAKGEALDHLLPEAYALVREAARRVLGLWAHDVQILGAIALHECMIAEMKTGEGKTLVAAFAAYLNALSGKGVHVATVNPYLAQRDAEEVGAVLRALGMTVGCVVPETQLWKRKAQYAADVTYATTTEIGFDLLRDGMVSDLSQRVHRPFHYVIIDEADSVLLDEARTPLIISGAQFDPAEVYMAFDAVAAGMPREMVVIDLAQRTLVLTEAGQEEAERRLREAGLLQGGLYDASSGSVLHHLMQALRARFMYEKERDYVVIGGEVLIVDPFTGRTLPNRRWSDGLHQAIEAKEGVEIRPETRTLASLTIQNLFRSYPRLSGMTGTAKGEEEELIEIYGLEVLEIPTNRPVVRRDEPDFIYLRAQDRDEAVVSRIRDEHAKGRPVLVGTESVERSEHLSRLLDRAGLRHRVLNARQNAEEASVVAQAGRLGAITIATNMAGRGTDIKLGGDAARRIREELAHLDPADPAWAAEAERIRAEVEAERAAVVAAGGLFVIGVGRHESRRVDDQLRGRSGRQGDPGGSAFYVSMEDPLMRTFGGERIAKLLAAAGMREGEALVSPMVARALEKAQRRAEALAFEARRQVLRYDEVQNAQRLGFQKTRDRLVSDGLDSSELEEMRAEVLERILLARLPEEALPEQWDLEGLVGDLDRVFGLSLPLEAWAKEEGVDAHVMWERVSDAVGALFAERAEAVGRKAFNQAAREILVAELDAAWRDHMEAMASLRQGIGLRAYGQRDPLREWQIEAYGLYQKMMAEARERTVVRVARLQPPPPVPKMPPMPHPLSPVMRRNAPCPCGSGRRWKRCHGHPRLAAAVR